MALANFTDLKTSVASWLHRTDLTAIIPDLITSAEARLNRALRLSQMETDAALVGVPSSPFVALPSTIQTPIALWITTYSPRDKLTYLQPQDLPYDTAQGYPSYWTIDGSNIKFNRPVDLAYAITLRYYQRLQLSDAAPTNFLLTNNPDLYLYAVLMEASPYEANDERMGVWASKYSAALTEVLNNENRTKSMAILTTDLPGGGYFDINRGY
jgi:hypothetical protein